MRRFVLACALAAVPLLAQSELLGSVHDSAGRPVAAAKVELKTQGQTLTALTDSGGNYRFQVPAAGNYTLHAGEAQSGDSDFGPFALGPHDSRKIDLTLRPQFFDSPSFIVAGVTDPAQRGGHGTDVVLRSAETLAKETLSLGAVAEKPGAALETVRQYQRAAELDPSEANLFNWGAELLAHRAGDQAAEVFSTAKRLFPRSTRVLLGLAVAYYSRGSYQQAAEYFFEAADLDPRDPVPYLFLGKVSTNAITDSAGYAQRMERFVKLQPDNAWANYYCALDLWKRQLDTAKVQSLLEKAVRLDRHFGAAFLQLGIVLAAENNLPAAIAAYRSAIDAAPQLEEAHYRLAQAYRKSGEEAKAQQELAIFKQLSDQSARELDRERSEILQFVFTLKPH
jgi:tetratricopeptide (TPR) repeat protein